VIDKDEDQPKMKQLVKRVFGLFGLGVYRLPANGSRQPPPKFVVSSTLGHNSKEGLDEFYSDREMVESYLDYDFYNRVIDLLQAHQIDCRDKNVADVGCGIGHLLRMISERSQPASLTGFDFSEAALKIARTVVPGARFSYFDIYEGTDLRFDLVFCVEVLEHLLHPERALSSVVRMIMPGGVAVITVPNGRTDTFDGHINFWSPESWEVFIKNAGHGLDVTTGKMDDGATNFAIIKRKQ